MRYEADDDQLMDAMLLELQIQVGVGETAGAPMFLRDDLARMRCEFGAEFAAPGAVLKVLRCHAALWIGATYFHVS